MNVLLSLLLSLVMLFTGAVSIPEQPETSHVLTVTDVVFSVGDQKAVLSPSLKASAAVGTQQAALSFAVLRDQLPLFPVDVQLDGENVLFGVHGRQAFSILDDDLAKLLLRYLPKEAGNQVHPAAAVFAALPGLISVATHPVELHKVAQAWIKAENASSKKVTVEAEGQTFSCKKSTVKLTAKETLSGLSAFEKSEDPHLQSLAHHLLGRYQYDVRKVLQSMIPEDAWKLIFSIVHGAKEDASYLHMELESNVDMVLTACADEKAARWNIELTDGKRAATLTAEIAKNEVRLSAQSDRIQAQLLAVQAANGCWTADLSLKYGSSSLYAQAVQSTADGMPAFDLSFTAERAKHEPLSLACRVLYAAESYEPAFSNAQPLLLTDDTGSDNFKALKKQLLLLAPDAAVLMMDSSVGELLKMDLASVWK